MCHFKPACTPCAFLYLLFVLAPSTQAAVNISQEGVGDYSGTPAEDQANFSTIDVTPFLNETVDAVVASLTAGSTTDAGDDNTRNAQLDINGDSVWAILFPVKVP